MLKTNKNLNELIELVNEFVKKTNSTSNVSFKRYEGNFSNEAKDVLIFWFGSCSDTLSFIQSLMSAFSALKNGNKIHLFSTQDNEYNFSIIKILELCNIDMDSNFKFSIISLDDFDNLKAYKRAKKFGNISYFPHFNFWCVKNLEYERINIFHNDNVFYNKINYSEEDQIVCWISNYSKKRHNKFRMMRKIKSKFDIDKNEFYKNHIHTGVLSINKDVKKAWCKFLIENFDWINENWNVFMYHEQELLAIVKQLGEFKLTHSNESKVWRYSNDSFFIHYDENHKETLYIDDGIINCKKPHNSKTRQWNEKSINIIREVINDLDLVITEGLVE